jgi:hypothetical protein
MVFLATIILLVLKITNYLANSNNNNLNIGYEILDINRSIYYIKGMKTTPFKQVISNIFPGHSKYHYVD